MPVAKLTKRFVDTIEMNSRRVVYYDSDLKGSGVRVTPTGVKSWCVEYRPRGGGRSTAKRRMVLGSTSALTPDQARSAARKILAAVALGEDPAASRSRAREMPTFRQFADRYLDEEAATKLKPRSLVNYCIYLRKHAGALIGNLRLDRVTANDIAKMHRRIGQTMPVTANRVVECVGSVYRFAATCGLVDRSFNPAAYIEAVPRATPRKIFNQRGIGSTW